MTREQRKRLPRAPLFRIARSHGKWMLARFRIANAHEIFVGPFNICIRAPWLEHSARQLHPEVFATSVVLHDRWTQ